MKWWIVLTCSLLSVVSFGQTNLLSSIPISCQLNNHTLEEAFAILSKNDAVTFSFNPSILPSDKRYTYHFQETPLRTVLNVLLRATDLNYQVVNDFIIIKRRKAEEPPLEPETYSISGVVENALSGERLIGASVYILAQDKGSYSNTNGYYSFYAEADSVLIQASYVGYETASIRMSVFENKQLTFKLKPDAFLDSIVVVDSPFSPPVLDLDMGSGGQKISDLMIDRMPGMLGEPDPIHTLGWLPGVQSGTEDLGNLSIRNSENGHNLILLDGAQIYNPNHLLGLYSVFNSSAIKDVELIKGAMPAKYGERLASVIEINGREGDFNEFHAEGSLSLIVAKAMIEGPIIKEKMSYLISGRRSYFDLIARGILSEITNDVSTGYFFDDINVKIAHKISERDNWSATFYFGGDQFKFEENREVRTPEDPNRPAISDYTVRNTTRVLWNNVAGSVKWNRWWRDNTFSSFSAVYSRYRFLVRLESEQKGLLNQNVINRNFNLLYFSGVQDIGFRADFETTFPNDLIVKYGASATWHLYQPQASGTGFLNFTEIFETNPEQEEGEVEVSPLQLNAQESGLYVDAFLKMNQRWQLQAGLHLASFSNGGAFYASLQPRLKIRYDLGSKTWLQFMTRINQQYAHLLTNTRYNLPTDLWVPSNDKVRPQLGWQVGLGLEKRLGRKYIFQVDAYYQYLDKISTLNPAESLQKGRSWEDKILQGFGHNYGAELAIQKIRGPVTGILSYHYSWAWRRFPLLNGGNNFPFRYNRRHSFSILCQYQINSNVSLSSGWTISSGNYISISNRQIPFGFPGTDSFIGVNTGTYDADASVNNFRVPFYHRLDFNIDFTKKRSSFIRKWSIGVYNLYNQKNPSFYNIGFQQSGRRSLTGIVIFTIIPSIKYQLKF